jgi:flagellar hook assembly protein FlgD
MLGQRVRTLVHAEQKAGTHVAQWDGRNEQGIPVTSGVYFCRMRVGSFETTRKLARVR